MNFSNTPLSKELYENSEDAECLRISNESFEFLLKLVKPHIEKKNTILRQPISAEQNRISTLILLVTGRSLRPETLNRNIISKSFYFIIIWKTCKAKIRALRKVSMSFIWILVVCVLISYEYSLHFTCLLYTSRCV